jgi:hypothetical protein
MLSFTGASAATSIYAPPVSKQYILWNNTSYAITIYNSTVIGNTTAAGTGVTLSAGDKIQVWSNGTNFYDVKATGLTSTLGIANGGTGQTTQQAAINALTGTQTANRVLRSDGTNATLSQVALTTDVTGTLPLANGGTGVTTLAALGNLFHPVGCIYTSTSSTNPGTSLGFGTWVAFGAGRVMIGAGTGGGGTYTAGATGGSKDASLVSHTHTFTGTALPAHTHDYVRGNASVFIQGAIGGTGLTNQFTSQVGSVSGGTPAGTNSTEGVTATDANLQPYIVVYMWERTA